MRSTPFFFTQLNGIFLRYRCGYGSGYSESHFSKNSFNAVPCCVTKFNVSQVVAMIEKQMTYFRVPLQLLLTSIFVVLVFIAAAVKSGLYFVP
jgi:hypothetical protein